jgi:Protein of unknown function (DUF3489)
MTTPKTTRKATPRTRPTQQRPAAKPVKKSRRRATKKPAVQSARPGTKQATLIALLERPVGATIAQMCARTGWQAHSVRAALTGLRKRGIAVTRTKDESGSTVYHAGQA